MDVRSIFFLTLFCAFFPITTLWAGPPFATDDPEPVEVGHWEVFLATSYAHSAEGETGNVPQLDINYGLMPDVHVNLVTPFVFANGAGVAGTYGFGDVEVGVKYRFLKGSPDLPDMGFYPRVFFPTGNEAQGLGEGHYQFGIPLWIEKTWGPWSTYGGGGYWFHPGGEDSVSLGWEIQREMSEAFTLGAEVLYHGTVGNGAEDKVGFNVGGTFNLDSVNHLLAAVGRDLTPNGDDLTVYFAYQWTYPGEEKEP